LHEIARSGNVHPEFTHVVTIMSHDHEHSHLSGMNLRVRALESLHARPIEPRPALPAATRAAYLNAVYRIHMKGEPDIDMRIDERNEAVIALLKKHDAQSAVFVTAFNPFGAILDIAANETRQQTLAGHLRASQIKTFEGVGFDPHENPPHSEASLFALDVTRPAADALMQKFEQNAVVFVDADGVPELLLHPIHR
jgi:hypothetical protein